MSEEVGERNPRRPLKNELQKTIEEWREKQEDDVTNVDILNELDEVHSMYLSRAMWRGYEDE